MKYIGDYHFSILKRNNIYFLLFKSPNLFLVTAQFISGTQCLTDIRKTEQSVVSLVRVYVVQFKQSCFPYFVLDSFEVVVNNTNLTFLSFLYKVSIEVSLRNKVASSVN